jgi:hypothetical protein
MRRTLAVSLAVFALVVGWGFAAPACRAAGASTSFEDITLAPNSYWNGSDGAGGFTTGPASFNNLYTPALPLTLPSWGGWSVSNMTPAPPTDELHFTPVEQQYTAATGGARSGSNYAVAHMDKENHVGPVITLDTPSVVAGAWFTNVETTCNAMANGFTTPGIHPKKFGGESGTDPDVLLLNVIGHNASGAITGIVQLYLADFRSADSSQDYILNAWQHADLTSLGVVKTLEFSLYSTDRLDWDQYTPEYFAMDDLELATATPEPATLTLLGLGAAATVLRRRRKN